VALFAGALAIEGTTHRASREYAGPLWPGDASLRAPTAADVFEPCGHDPRVVRRPSAVSAPSRDLVFQRNESSAIHASVSSHRRQSSAIVTTSGIRGGCSFFAFFFEEDDQRVTPVSA
jgi:hypothetical protein